jgi:hypothetical protein
MASTGKAPVRAYGQKPEFYVMKLKKVMERFGAKKFDYDYGLKGAYIQFTHKGRLCNFEQTLEKAAGRGIKLKDGQDCFAQLVLSLEKLIWLEEQGIYEMEVWLEGIKMLTAQSTLPEAFRVLQFTELPESVEDLKKRYHQLAADEHPDKGGSDERFRAIQTAYKDCLRYMEGGAGA